MGNGDKKKDGPAKTKGKLGVGKFIELMTGGTVVIDDGALGPRSRAYASAGQLQVMQTRLEELRVPCPDIQRAIDTYNQDLKQAMQEPTKSVQDRLFDVLAAQTLQADAHFELYVAAATKLTTLRADVVATIDLKASEVAVTPAGKLRAMLEGSVASFRARLPQTDQVATLPELSSRQEALVGLDREVRQLSDKAVAAQVQRYQDAMSELLLSFRDKEKTVSALPSTQIRDALAVSLAALQSQLVPLDQIASLPDLSARLQSTKEIATQLEAFGNDQVSPARQYQELTAQELEAYNQKAKEAAALPDDALRNLVQSALDELHRQCMPLDQLTSVDELDAKLKGLKAGVDKLKALEVDRLGQIAAEYQRVLGELPDVNQKAKEIASLTSPALQSLMTNELDTLKEAFVPLAPKVSASDLQWQLDRLKGSSLKLSQLEVEACRALLQEHDKLLSDLPGEIDAMATRVAGQLGTGAQAALRSEFMRQLDGPPPSSLAGLRSRIESLKKLRAALGTRQVAKPSSAMKKQLAGADSKMADARKRLNDQPTPELRKASADALNELESALSLLKINAPDADLRALGLPDDVVLGKVQGSGFTKFDVMDTERARSLNAAIKAVELAMNNADSTEAKLLALDGGEKFVRSLCQINTNLIASGSNHKGISPAEALAIHRYTGDDYSPMNRQRRGESDDERLAFLNKTCDEALAKMPLYPDAAWPTFRIETAWSQDVVVNRYGEGRQFTCGILWSTGARGVAAINLSGSPTFTHVIYGKKGRDVAALSANAFEGATENTDVKASAKSGRGEVLFPADSKFLVAKRVDDPGSGPSPIPYNKDGGDAKINTTLREVING